MKLKEIIKKNKKLLIFLLLGVVIIFGNALTLNYLVYHRLIVPYTPFKTLSLLYKAFLKTSKIQSKLKLVKIMSVYLIPLILYLMYGVAKIYNKIVFNTGYNTKKNEKKRATLKGSSHWATNEEIAQFEYLFENNEKHLPALIFGQSNDAVLKAPTPFKVKTVKKGKYIIGADVSKKLGETPTVNHTMIIGITRSGKGVSTIIPTLLSYKSSVVCYDPAGENYEKTAYWRKTLGEVQFFDPQNLNSTLHFNPLGFIRQDEQFILTDIENICQILIKNTDPKAKFFDDSARDLLKVFIEYVLCFYDKDEQNLYNVATLTTIMNKDSAFSVKALKYKKKIAEKMLSSNEEHKEVFLKLIENLDKEIEKEKEREEIIKALMEEKRKELEESLKYDGRIERKITDEEVYEQVREENKAFFSSKDGLIGFIDRLYDDFKRELSILPESDVLKSKRTLLENGYNTLDTLRNLGAMKSEQTMGSITQTLNANLLFFTNSTIMKLMDKNTFAPEDLTMREKPLSLYLCISNQDTERCKTFIELFFTLLTNGLTGGDLTSPDKQENEEVSITNYAEKYKKYGRHTVLFLIDEFPQLGRLKTIEMGIPFTGKYGIAYMLCIQDLMQLKNENAYGDKGAESMINNMQMICVKKVGNDKGTREWVSNILGMETIIFDNSSISGTVGTDVSKMNKSKGIQVEGRSLMTPDEVARMDNGEQIVLITGCPPIKCKKLQYFTDPMFSSKIKEIKSSPIHTSGDNSLFSFTSILGKEIEDEEDDEDEKEDIEEDNGSDTVIEENTEQSKKEEKEENKNPIDILIGSSEKKEEQEVIKKKIPKDFEDFEDEDEDE